MEKLSTNAEKLACLLNKPKKVLLVTHINPDGDAIGSTMGLYHFLKKTGHIVEAMVPNGFPEFLAWMKDTNKIIVFQENASAAKTAINNAEVIICVDFNDMKRLKDLGPILEVSNAIKVLIDHHPYPPKYYDYYYHDISVSSTAELVYSYIKNSGQRDILDSTSASCVYCGIMTDTGCFSFNSSKPATFNAVADLLTCQIDKDQIFNNVYNNFSYQRMKLMGYCLNEKMVIIPDLHAAYISLSAAEMNKYQFKPGDTEGFVNLPFSIKGIHIAALFTERKENVRISLRSKGEFAINQICEKYFLGGGHKNAAGGESNLSLNETIAQFENLLLNYKDEINHHYGN